MSEKSIFKKVIGIGTSNYQGLLIKKSVYLYELEIAELKHGIEKKEVKENEQQLVRTQKIRPHNDGSLGASDVAKLQKKIDQYLDKISVDEALTTVISGKGKNKDTSRKIDSELGFQCERWIDESFNIIEVPVSKNVPTTTQKAIGSIPFYFRPSSGQVNKSIKNFIKQKSL